MSSSIERFTVPLHLTVIHEHAFDSCTQLRIFDISENSELQEIGLRVFEKTSITSIRITPHLTIINHHAFANCETLQIIEFDENSELDYIKLWLFACSEQAIAMVPVIWRNIVI